VLECRCDDFSEWEEREEFGWPTRGRLGSYDVEFGCRCDDSFVRRLRREARTIKVDAYRTLSGDTMREQ